MKYAHGDGKYQNQVHLILSKLPEEVPGPFIRDELVRAIHLLYRDHFATGSAFDMRCPAAFLIDMIGEGMDQRFVTALLESAGEGGALSTMPIYDEIYDFVYEESLKERYSQPAGLTFDCRKWSRWTLNDYGFITDGDHYG